MPTPPAAVATTKAIRTSDTSTPNRLAMPAATPAIQPSSRSRRRTPAEASDVVTRRSSRARHPRGHQNRPDGGAGERHEPAEPEVQRLGGVEQEDQTHREDGRSGHER